TLAVALRVRLLSLARAEGLDCLGRKCLFHLFASGSVYTSEYTTNFRIVQDGLGRRKTLNSTFSHIYRTFPDMAGRPRIQWPRTRRPRPFGLAVVGRRKPDRPERDNALPARRGEHGFVNDLARELGQDRRMDDEFLTIGFQIDHREILAIFR